MGLPRALKAHGQGDLDQAEHHYKRALEQDVRDPILFQNYGALLRGQGKEAEADVIYKQGLSLFPEHIGLLTNRANLLREEAPASSLACHFSALRLLRRDSSKPPVAAPFINTIAHLRELGLHQWAWALAREALSLVGPHGELLLQCLLLQDGASTGSETEATTRLRQRLESQLDDCAPLERSEVLMALASHHLGQSEVGRAEALFEQAMGTLTSLSTTEVDDLRKAQQLVDLNSWNYSIALLQQQQLERGWKLFEHGLRTPAAGPQRWQRAMKKPFSAEQLPLWRGESLEGRRLLLLEEQAIGDAMMFCTLIPSLLEEAAQLGLVVSDRLLPIYRRSFATQIEAGTMQVCSHEQLKDGAISASGYDVQTPLGSICQYRFQQIERYGNHLPLLKPEPDQVEQFRTQYLNDGSPAERLIGLSWNGGGKGKRIKQKSLDPKVFGELLRALPGVRFVSLQYGKAEPVVEAWRQQGLDVIHDPRVNPLKDMDLWLAQVAACDGVLSVANTTIHGAGGLNVPTLCLLSRFLDWRWFADPSVARSYWYPSVGIARESLQEGWQPALTEARQWLEQGCPMPNGSVHTHESVAV